LSSRDLAYSMAMREEQQLYLAQLVRDHREHLKEVLDEIVERGEPVSELEARLLVDATSLRLGMVENKLRIPARRRRRVSVPGVSRLAGAGRLRRQRLQPARVRRILARIRSWARPRLGLLRHYEPKPLRVPRKYVRTRPPDPAPTISIVTPSFQHGRFIERTIHSVLAQGYPALEHIVQDGGSTDETLDVLRGLDGRLAGWSSERDRGQADAINRAFAQTTGEIMAWLNSDDLLLPGALTYIARYFAKHPKVDAVYGHRVMIDENDGQIGAWILPRHSDLALTLADWVPNETLFWRRRIWDAAGGRVDPGFDYAIDWDLLLRFREAGAKMVRLPRFLGAFRVHAEQKTTSADVLGLEEMARLRERVHGRPVSIEEALVRLRPYFLRHIAVHTRQRIVDRVPLRRIDVQASRARPAQLPRPEHDIHTTDDLQPTNGTRGTEALLTPKGREVANPGNRD
jgi:glycosyltransferase involved in cell wall biosynthesis